MTDPNKTKDREAGPLLEPGERPMSEGKRWAILLGFAVIVFGAAFSIDHQKVDKGSEPPAAATATQPAPPSTSAVAPQPAPAAPSSGG